jgi:hypothetical protein
MSSMLNFLLWPRSGRLSTAGACALLLFLALHASARSAYAVPTVYLEPDVSIVDEGAVFDVCVMVNADADTISTFDVVFRFDPGVVEMVAAYEGSLYAECPYTTWFVAEEESAGTWEVWDVIFPGGTFVVAPGELAVLRFRAKEAGYSALDFLTATVCDIDRLPLSPLESAGGFICVGGGGGTGLPLESSGDQLLRLGLPYPNPTRGPVNVAVIGSPGGGPGFARAGVFDGRGRFLREILAGSPRSLSVLRWDGRDERGEEVPAGIYFVRLETSSRAVSRKIVVIR